MRNILLLLLCMVSMTTNAQTKNTSTEVIDYREVDGKIIVQLAVNGVMADFALDLAGHNAVLPEYLEKLKIDAGTAGNFQYSEYLYKNVPVSGSVQINSLSLGNSIFESGTSAFLLKDASYLKKIGVAGVLGSSFFSKSVLTIDSREKKITVSVPFRPAYMKLDHRVDMELLPANAILCPGEVLGDSYSLLLDTWSDGTLILNADDFRQMSGEPTVPMDYYAGYSQKPVHAQTKKVDLKFVKSAISGALAIEDTVAHRSRYGNGLLKEGIISIDYQRQKIYFQPFDLVKIDYAQNVVDDIKIKAGELNPITREYFLKHIYDYRTGKEFVSKLDRPVVIDFWASWCGPCMRLLPEMEKLAEKYGEEVLFMKVNADKEKELCNIFKVEALPTLFFIPSGKAPIIKVGADKEQIIEIIEKKLLQSN